MRSLVAIAVAALALAAGLATRTSAGTVVGKPSLHPVRGAALVIRGAGWTAQEHVTVTLHATTTLTVHVVAGADGRFTARFAYVPGRCAVWWVVAAGTKSGRAVYRTPRVDCAPVY